VGMTTIKVNPQPYFNDNDNFTKKYRSIYYSKQHLKKQKNANFARISRTKKINNLVELEHTVKLLKNKNNELQHALTSLYAIKNTLMEELASLQNLIKTSPFLMEKLSILDESRLQSMGFYTNYNTEYKPKEIVDNIFLDNCLNI
jgi:hypothetical protein